ncbi:MAG: hypothetical protein KC442_15525, partial [Thermomicrobiales bacterium]|nr:hypothetical protein [Thermomicrobiales bacterium]
AALPVSGLLLIDSDGAAAEKPRNRLKRRTRQRKRKQRNRRQRNQQKNQSGSGGGGRTPALETATPCEISSDCPATSLCVDGFCQPCDVCPRGCTFTNLHAAIDSSAQPSIIRVCPGTYQPVVIQRPLALIGAGDGDDQSSNTILQGEPGFSSVVTVNLDDAMVTLQGLLITGGNGSDGGGIYNRGNLLMSDVTVSGNTATNGGGIYNAGSVSLAGCSVTGNTATDGGGIYSGGGQVLLQSGTRVSGNSSDNCGGPGPYAG